MTKESPIINILTYKLDFKLSGQIYNEYQNRLKEAKFKIENFKTYKILESDMQTIELLLALSVFHKRVIANLDAATKFYGKINGLSGAETIKMGTYSLNGLEKNKILAVIITYNKLIEKFSVPPTIMDYNETSDFLKKVISLKKALNNGSNQAKNK